VRAYLILVATLASMFLVNGLTLIGVSGQSVAEGMLVNGEQATGVFAPIFKWLGSGSFFNVPASVIVSGLVFIVVYVLLNLTRWGRHSTLSAAIRSLRLR